MRVEDKNYTRSQILRRGRITRAKNAAPYHVERATLHAQVTAEQDNCSKNQQNTHPSARLLQKKKRKMASLLPLATAEKTNVTYPAMGFGLAASGTEGGERGKTRTYRKRRPQNPSFRWKRNKKHEIRQNLRATKAVFVLLCV